MWLSQKNLPDPRWDDKPANTGNVTISSPLSVLLDTEVREIPLISPGGYVWRPRVGQSLLVIKTGDDDYTALAPQCETIEDLDEGEICIKSNSHARIFLRNNGSISISGDIAFDGDATFNGNVTFEGDAAFNGNTAFDGDVSVSQDLSVNGITRLGRLFVNGIEYKP